MLPLAGVVAETMGAVSPLPLIVTVWTKVAPRVALVGVPIVKVIVSSGSGVPSLTMVTVTDALVEPAWMVSGVGGAGVVVKSVVAVAVPPIVNGTVTSLVVGADNCAVTWATTPSATVWAAAVHCTVGTPGAASSSTMVAVTVLGLPIPTPGALAIPTTTVSFPSTSASAMPVRVIAPLSVLAGMVTLAAEAV